jgi:hypothetical protein
MGFFLATSQCCIDCEKVCRLSQLEVSKDRVLPQIDIDSVVQHVLVMRMQRL